MADIWWEVYRKFFLNMKLKKKLLIGFLILSVPPIIMLGVAAIFFMPAGVIRNVFLLMDVLGIGVIILLAYIFSRNIARQILQLTAGAREIARGNLQYQLEVEESTDEIGELADATKKMVGALTDSLESTNSIIQGLGEALYITDENLVVTHFNPAAAKLLGYSQDEIIGKHCYDFTEYVGVEAACHTPNCSSKKVMKGEAETLTREVVLRSKNGEEIPVKISTSPLRDAEGNRIGAIKLATDLRALKEKEKQVKDALMKTEAIVTNLGVPLITIDNDFKILNFNPAAEELIGYSADEVVGKKHCYEVVPGPTCNTNNCTAKLVEEFGTVHYFDNRDTKKNGTIPVEISAGPFLDADGNSLGTVMTVADLREVKTKEKEIQAAKEYLENQVDRLLPVVAASAEGDLVHEITAERDDAFGALVNSFNSMLKGLRNLVAQVKDAVATVTTTSEQLASSGQEMNATTQEISSSIQQIAQGAQDQVRQMNMASREMKKIAEMSESIARGSQLAAEVAEKANTEAKKGGEAAKEAIKKMRESTEVVKQTAEAVKSLGDRSTKIVEITDLITNIAEQTNLLALNAAIEAARAGEHGRGFAVVAEEVRKLAEGSAKAAEQIGTLIREISADIGETVKSMDITSNEVTEASEVVNKALGALENILNSVEDLTSKVGEISAATEEQSMASEKVVKAIDDIAAAAEEAAASSEESNAAIEEQTASMEELSAAAQELANIASKLDELVGKFKIEKTE
jgi:methyl-accepting chemotaxis protein